MTRRGRRGFTLMELLIVVVIIAIVAAIGMPSYRKAIERNYWRGAQDVLRAIYSGEQVYWTQRDTYVQPTACPAPDPAWRCIGMDNPNLAADPPTQYVVDNVAANTFRVTAVRGDGRCMSIDNNNNLVFASGLGGCGANWTEPP